MIDSLLGRGPKMVDIAAVNFVGGTDVDISRIDEGTYWKGFMSIAAAAAASRSSDSTSAEDKATILTAFSQVAEARQLRLSINIVTDRAGFSIDRLLCLTYLLSIEHQMRVLSHRRKEDLYNLIKGLIGHSNRWSPSDTTRFSVPAPFPVLAVTVRVRRRHTPFITFHPKLLSPFPGGIEACITEFLSSLQLCLTEKVNADDLAYTRDGLRSLVAFWGQHGLPRSRDRIPGLPFILHWQQ
jgi:hypothetical protein